MKTSINEIIPIYSIISFLYFILCYSQQNNPYVQPRFPDTFSPTPPSPGNPFSIPGIQPAVPSAGIPSSAKPVPPVPAHSQEQYDLLTEEINRFEEIQRRRIKENELEYLLNYGFPSMSHHPGTRQFYEAFNEIESMLAGTIPLNIGRAVFLVENAYYQGRLDYNDFRQAVKQRADIYYMILEQEEIEQEDKFAKNLLLFKYLTDTMELAVQGMETALCTYPLQYDYDDYKSELYYDSHFVTKLMRTNIGQCNSMPLYYLILAEEIGTEAYWAFSPRHSYIKIKDEKDRWYNLELTNGCVMTDAHYMNNSFIKSEALNNRIYFEPMDKEQVAAEMLISLAQGYYETFGFDDFTLACTAKAKEYLQRPLNALLMESSYQTLLTLTLGRLLEADNPVLLKEKSPKAYEHYLKMHAQYEEIDNTGYEEVPLHIYEKWLEYIARQKEKLKNNGSL